MTWDEVEEFIDGGEIKDEMAPRGGFGGVEGGGGSFTKHV